MTKKPGHKGQPPPPTIPGANVLASAFSVNARIFYLIYLNKKNAEKIQKIPFFVLRRHNLVKCLAKYEGKSNSRGGSDEKMQKREKVSLTGVGRNSRGTEGQHKILQRESGGSGNPCWQLGISQLQLRLRLRLLCYFAFNIYATFPSVLQACIGFSLPPASASASAQLLNSLPLRLVDFQPRPLTRPGAARNQDENRTERDTASPQPWLLNN